MTRRMRDLRVCPLASQASDMENVFIVCAFMKIDFDNDRDWAQVHATGTSS
jgi:hypothetical protein